MAARSAEFSVASALIIRQRVVTQFSCSKNFSLHIASLIEMINRKRGMTALVIVIPPKVIHCEVRALPPTAHGRRDMSYNFFGISSCVHITESVNLRKVIELHVYSRAKCQCWKIESLRPPSSRHEQSDSDSEFSLQANKSPLPRPALSISSLLSSQFRVYVSIGFVTIK